MAERHIVGLGGGGDTKEQTDNLYEYILGLTGKERPRVLFIPTAAAEDPEYTVWFYDRFARRGEASHLNTFPWPPENLREVILSQDVINVSGGNTANMLAIWKVHGIDTLLREAWENGVVLCGASAGMICWFEGGVTDSFGPQLAGTTTARSSAALATANWSTAAFPKASRPTMVSASTTWERRSRRS
jgi:dipeptidase E